MPVFGPIPSRRLGQSIGIDNIPAKTCSYSCIYCQLGRTDKMQIKRDVFYKSEEIVRDVGLKLGRLKMENKSADYISFVPDGEPTLDANLGKTIRLLKPFGVKTAVISNASLIWREDVREDLMKADWVSLSIDAVDEETWGRIDRPHGALDRDEILEGILKFSKKYKGELVSETMLVEGVNDSTECLERIAGFIDRMGPDQAYILVPTRPPAEDHVKRPGFDKLREAMRIFRGVSGVPVECITGDEEEEGFFFTDDITGDLIETAAVHPVRESVVDGLLKKRNLDKSVITELVNRGLISEFFFEGKKFYKKTGHKNIRGNE